ncbi:MAG TPA: hypothetical protein PKK06_14615 [Phycisphaerae bacterium]|nr:hypothetical protein [Phycisphaerae bacterium]HNU46484.1 hypothetical protein [Phycisphaerae bacterium]
MGGCATPPKGTPWTILCLELQGRYAVQTAGEIGEALRRTPGIRAKEVSVRDDDDGFSRVYYGTYYRQTDPQTGKRTTPPQMVADLNLIKGLGNEKGQYFFRQAMLVRQPQPDVGNPEWALRRSSGMYTLQVAVFEPTDDFAEYKQAAADLCAYLRQRGFEAFYHHGNACSMVTVGAFGPEAMVRRDGQPAYSDEVLALQRQPELRYNLLNGAPYRPLVDGKRLDPVPSQLVLVPGHEPEEGVFRPGP